MKVMVVGGTGHVGQFMVPMLVEAGCEVIVVGTGRTTVPSAKVWQKVKYVAYTFGSGESAEVLAREKAEVVIEMPGMISDVYAQFKGQAKHIIACGSTWMFGEPRVVPCPEQTQNQCAFESYAARYAELEQLLAQSASDGVAFSAIMPPNICGPGKIPLECSGGRSIEVHEDHASGKGVVLPEGPEALIGPTDAEDIASCFAKAVLNRDKAAGEFFNVGAAYALTASHFVATYGEIYGVEIPIRRVDWQQYAEKINPDIGAWWHFRAHMCPDISKARRLLGYEPKYTPQQTMARGVDWMREQKLL